MSASYPPGVQGLAAEVRDLRAQLAAVTAERDTAVATGGSIEQGLRRRQFNLRELRHVARHLLAWQQARGLEVREALAGLLESVEIVLERWPPGVARDSLLGALQDEPERARAALAGKGDATEPDATETLGRLLDEAGLHVYAHKPGCSMDGCSCRSESLAGKGGGA